LLKNLLAAFADWINSIFEVDVNVCVGNGVVDVVIGDALQMTTTPPPYKSLVSTPSPPPDFLLSAPAQDSSQSSSHHHRCVLRHHICFICFCFVLLWRSG
jgi:hypothetical protein